MAIINDLTVFTTVSGGGGASARTNFRADDDFSTDGYTDDIAVSASLPQNIGIAFVNSSESPVDYATISLNGDDTSTVYVNNSAGSVDLNVSGSGTFSGQIYASGITLIASNGSRWTLGVDVDGNLITTGADGVRGRG
jgi:hypothetical protein